MKVRILLLMIIITNEKKHQSSNDGSTFIDQKLKTSPQLFHNDTFANDATTCMFSQYPYYPPDKILNTQKTFSYIFTYFPFCHHLILVLKVVPPLQVHELVCILSSVFFLNNLHTPQFFKNYPLFSNILSSFVSFQLYYKRSLEKC